MIRRLLMALAVLSGQASDGMSRAEASRVAGAHGLRGGSGGGIRRALNLKGRPAFNEYRNPEELATRRSGADLHAGMVAQWIADHRQNRNAAKARRRALRSPKPRPRVYTADKIEITIAGHKVRGFAHA